MDFADNRTFVGLDFLVKVVDIMKYTFWKNDKCFSLSMRGVYITIIFKGYQPIFLMLQDFGAHFFRINLSYV